MRSSTRRGKCFIILVKAPAKMPGAGAVSALTHADAPSPTKDCGLILVYRGKILIFMGFFNTEVGIEAKSS